MVAQHNYTRFRAVWDANLVKFDCMDAHSRDGGTTLRFEGNVLGFCDEVVCLLDAVEFLPVRFQPDLAVGMTGMIGLWKQTWVLVATVFGARMRSRGDNWVIHWRREVWPWANLGSERLC